MSRHLDTVDIELTEFRNSIGIMQVSHIRPARDASIEYRSTLTDKLSQCNTRKYLRVNLGNDAGFNYRSGRSALRSADNGRRLQELLRRLVIKGHSVTLFCSNYKGGSREDEVEGVRIIRAGNRYNFNLIAPVHIRRLVRREKFDLFLEDINKIPFYSPLYLDLPSIIIIPRLIISPAVDSEMTQNRRPRYILVSGFSAR